MGRIGGGATPQDRERLHWRTGLGQAEQIVGVNGLKAGRHREGSRPACSKVNYRNTRSMRPSIPTYCQRPNFWRGTRRTCLTSWHGMSCRLALRPAQHAELPEQPRGQQRLQVPYDAHGSVAFGRVQHHPPAGTVRIPFARPHEQLELPAVGRTFQIAPPHLAYQGRRCSASASGSARR